MSDEVARRDEDAITEVSPEIPVEEPEFVIVGVRRPGGVVLFASHEITAAKFARRAEGFDKVTVPGAGRPAMLPRVRVIVGVEMLSFEQILADDYRSALQSLLGRMPQRAIASGHDT